MPDITPRTLVRAIAVALFTALAALTWDGWWHISVGRESFWIPPHLLLYLATLTAVALGAYGWYRNRRVKAYKRLALLLLAIPASAPFDELWHRVFGIEKLNSVLILWSPPHLVLIGALLGSLFLLLPLVRKDTAGGQQFFGGLVLAGVIQILTALTAPFFPTGPFGLAGFWGAGITAAALTTGLLLAARVMPGPAPAVLVAFMLVVFRAVGAESVVAPGVVVSPHDHAPLWLLAFALVIPAVLVDLMGKLPPVLRGSAYGMVWAYILFTFSVHFFQPQFWYPFNGVVTAVASSFIGGGAGGYLSAVIAEKLFKKK